MAKSSPATKKPAQRNRTSPKAPTKTGKAATAQTKKPAVKAKTKAAV